MKLPKKLIIAQIFLQRGSIEDVYSLSMEAILQEKKQEHTIGKSMWLT